MWALQITKYLSLGHKSKKTKIKSEIIGENNSFYLYQSLLLKFLEIQERLPKALSQMNLFFKIFYIYIVLAFLSAKT